GIVFPARAQGLRTDRYLAGLPRASRPSKPGTIEEGQLNEATLAKVRALHELAGRRGQSLAQMAVAWTLRDPRVPAALLGASSVAQLEANVAALDNLDFASDEQAEIDRHATEAGINLWEGPSRPSLTQPPPGRPRPRPWPPPGSAPGARCRGSSRRRPCRRPRCPRG